MTKTTGRLRQNYSWLHASIPLIAAALLSACGAGGEGGDNPSGQNPTGSPVALSPTSDLSSSGPAGGPFSPSSKSYTLTNTGTDPVDWTAIVSAGDTWVQVSAGSGLLGPGQQSTVVVSLAQAAAAALSPGTHPAQVVFLDETDGGEIIETVDVNLSVQPLVAGAILAVTPSVGFTAAGAVGGPFAPGTVPYTLENAGEQALTWSASTSEQWVTFSAASGSLQPDASVTVNVAIDQVRAAGLPAGSYQSAVEFTNLTNDVGSASFVVGLSIAAAPVPGTLSLSPSSGISSTGPQGGPFGSSTASYTLANFGSTTIAYSVAKTQSWVALSATSGSLLPNEVDVVTVSVNQGVAAGLPVGAYADTVAFTNTTNGLGSTSVPVALSVQGAPPPGQLVVTPTSSYSANGPEGGPFSPASAVYGLSNPGGQAFNWTAAVNQSWLEIPGLKSGQLAAGGSTSVTVTIKASAAASLPAGSYSGTITFANASGGAVVQQIAAALSVAEPVTPGAGWTVFTPSSDSRLVYVSSTLGNDANNGLSEGAPKASIAAGIAALRAGFPDWLLFKKGDTWNGGLGMWKKSGRSAAEPMLVSAYGNGARPRFLCGGGGGFGASSGGGAPSVLSHVSFVGLEFAGNNSGTGEGAAFLLQSNDILVEDVVIRNFSNGIVFQGFTGRHTNLRLRRSHVWENYRNGISNGIYVWGVDGLLIEECVFDTNGWFPGIDPADIFSHNMYIDNDCTGIVTVDNIVVNAASHGIQQRPGGEIRGNLLLRNPIAIVGGEGNYPEEGGVKCWATDNVIMDGRNIDANNPRGWGVVFANINEGEIKRNLIAKNVDGNFPLSLNIRGDFFADNYQTIGVHNVPIEDNVIYDWGEVHIEGNAGTHLSNLTLRRNEIQAHVTNDQLINHYYPNSIGAFSSSDNRLFSQTTATSAWVLVGSFSKSITQWKQDIGDTTSTNTNVQYTDATRTVGSWNALQGFGNSYAAFMQQVRLQSRDYWRPEYTAQVVNAWLRQGFDM